MFSDLFETLRDRWRSTFKPALQSLLSEKRSLFALFLASLLLETMLCVLFLASSANLILEKSLTQVVNIYIGNARKANDTVFLAALQTLFGKISGMSLANHAIFVFAVCVWFGISSFVFARMISSTVDLKKLVFGLYITFGADTKKVRRLIFWQMFLLGMVAFFFALPLSLAVCRTIYGTLPASAFSPGNLLPMFAVVILMLFTVIGSVARKTTANTCVSLLAAGDVSNSVHSPRKSSRRISAHRPSGLAATSILRMRGYYFTLILSGILPAALFFCCMSLAASDEIRGSRGVPEYTFSFPDGFESARFNDDYRPSLLAIPGVVSVTPSAGFSCAEDGHIFLTSYRNLASPNRTPHVTEYGGYAWDQVRIICGDLYSLMEKNLYPEAPSAADGTPAPPPPGCNTFDHCGIILPEAGTAKFVYPETEYGQPKVPYLTTLPESDTFFIAYPNADAVDLTVAEKFENNLYAGISLPISSFRVNNRYSQSSGGSAMFIKSILDEELIILNPVDFAALTGIDVNKNIENGVATPSVTLAEIGSYLIATQKGQTESRQAGTTVPYICAGNQLNVSIGDPYALERLGLPADTPLPSGSGKATLVIRRYVNTFTPDCDRLFLSGSTTVKMSYEDSLLYTEEDILHLRLANSQHFTRFDIENVVYSDSTDQDTLLICADDAPAIFDRRAPYGSIEVLVTPDIGIDELCRQTRLIGKWASSGIVYGSEPALTSQDLIWDVMLICTYRYNGILRVLAFLLALAVPFIWFSSQYNHYRKRKSDLDILNAIGVPRSGLFRTFLWEGLILALLCAPFILILCPLFTIFAYLFFEFNGFPFAYSSMDTRALLAVMLFSMLCAFLTTVVNYFFLYPPIRNKKRTSR